MRRRHNHQSNLQTTAIPPITYQWRHPDQSLYKQRDACTHVRYQVVAVESITKNIFSKAEQREKIKSIILVTLRDLPRHSSRAFCWLYLGKREQGQLESLFEKADVHLRLSVHSERVSERTPVNIHNERRSQAECFHSENLKVNCIFISIFFCEQSIQFGNANTGYQFLPRKLVVLKFSQQQLHGWLLHFISIIWIPRLKSCGKNNEEISGLVNFKNHVFSDFVFVGEIRCSTGHRRAKRSAWTQFGKF